MKKQNTRKSEDFRRAEKKFFVRKKIKKEIKKEKITADMSFGEVMSKYPKTQEVFLKHGMACFGCAFAMQESIEQGAMAHGIDAKKLLEDLNKIVK